MLHILSWRMNDEHVLTDFSLSIRLCKKIVWQLQKTAATINAEGGSLVQKRESLDMKPKQVINKIRFRYRHSSCFLFHHFRISCVLYYMCIFPLVLSFFEFRVFVCSMCVFSLSFSRFQVVF